MTYYFPSLTHSQFFIYMTYSSSVRVGKNTCNTFGRSFKPRDNTNHVRTWRNETFEIIQVQCLGYIIDERDVHVDLTKIQSIRDQPYLTTLTYLHSFLGLANFYRRFMLGFSHITWPFSQITKGIVKENFSQYESQQEAFVELKRFLHFASVLTLPNLQQPFETETSAQSEYTNCVVLTQHRNPVAYRSETLSDTIQKYPTYDKEIYSIRQAFQ